MKNYQNFGGQIFGSPQDRRFQIVELSLNDGTYFAKRDRIFPKIKPGKKILFVSYLIDMIRKSIRSSYHSTEREEVEVYVELISRFREDLMRCETEDEVFYLLRQIEYTEDHPLKEFLVEIPYEKLNRKAMEESCYGCQNVPLARAQRRLRLVDFGDIRINNDVVEEYLGPETLTYTTELSLEDLSPEDKILVEDHKVIMAPATPYDYEKRLLELTNMVKKPRKRGPRVENYAHLEHIERVGPDYRGIYDASTEDLLEKFSFYGGQYGIWLPQKERRIVTNHIYDAYADLAELLDINPKSITRGNLRLTLGSRGHKGAKAHFEVSLDQPLINMSRLKGAGSLAHETMHWFDFELANFLDLDTNFLSLSNEIPFESFERIMDYITSEDSDIYHDACILDRYEKRKDPYWTTSAELLARTFSSYCVRKLKEKGQRNDYLCYDFLEDLTISGEKVSPNPSRRDLNFLVPHIDQFIEDLKQIGFFERRKNSDLKLVRKKMNHSFEPQTPIRGLEQISFML